MNDKKTAQKVRKPRLAFAFTFIDDIIIIGVVVALVIILEVQLPVWLWFVIGLVSIGLMVMIHFLVYKSFSRKIIHGPEAMAGMEASVVEPCCPEGMVKLQGEYWQAKSVDGFIAEDETVEIVAARRLCLEVRRKR